MTLPAGITPAGTGKAAPSTDVAWSILGHTYWLKAEGSDCFAFETLGKNLRLTIGEFAVEES